MNPNTFHDEFAAALKVRVQPEAPAFAGDFSDEFAAALKVQKQQEAQPYFVRKDS